MDREAFDARMNDLLGKINALPESQRTRLEKMAEATRERRDKIEASVSELQESIDYLRLSVKYLVFDLEATRRENAYLRKLLEQANRDALEDRDEGHDGEDFLSDEA